MYFYIINNNKNTFFMTTTLTTTQSNIIDNATINTMFTHFTVTCFGSSYLYVGFELVELLHSVDATVTDIASVWGCIVTTSCGKKFSVMHNRHDGTKVTVKAK